MGEGFGQAEGVLRCAAAPLNQKEAAEVIRAPD